MNENSDSGTPGVILPTMVVVVAIAIPVALACVTRKLELIFSDVGVSLPAITQTVLNLYHIGLFYVLPLIAIITVCISISCQRNSKETGFPSMILPGLLILLLMIGGITTFALFIPLIVIIEKVN